jgi:GDP-L-fucose synthase
LIILLIAREVSWQAREVKLRCLDMKSNSRILIIGHKGPAGSALLKRLRMDGFNKALTVPSRLELTDQRAVALFFRKAEPEYVFLIDIVSGGIMANSSYPAEFIYANLQAQANIIHSARKIKTKKLIFIGSSCVYPKKCPQPMKEEYILTGALEPTSEAFALAKIAGIRMCQYYNRQYGTNFISAIPATVYGRNDDFSLENSHVIPALIRKFHEAKLKARPEVSVWGTGRPRREFLHIDDMADGCLFLMDCRAAPGIANMGAGKDISIRELAEAIKEITGFRGKLSFEACKPDGARKKLLDSGLLRSLGWKPKVGLLNGLDDLYHWYAGDKKGE